MLLKRKIKNRETFSYMNRIKFKNYFVYNRNPSDVKLLISQIMSLSRCKKSYTRKNLLKRFMGRFTVICLLFYPVKLIVYTYLYLTNKTDKIRRYSKSEIIIPVGSYIVFSSSLVYGGSNFFV